MLTIIAAIISLIIAGIIIDITLSLFVYWLIYVAIAWLLSLVGLQDYAFVVFVIFLLSSWWHRR